MWLAPRRSGVNGGSSFLEQQRQLPALDVVEGTGYLLKERLASRQDCDGGGDAAVRQHQRNAAGVASRPPLDKAAAANSID
jgi:hypothetical protein